MKSTIYSLRFDFCSEHIRSIFTGRLGADLKTYRQDLIFFRACADARMLVTLIIACQEVARKVCSTLATIAATATAFAGIYY